MWLPENRNDINLKMTQMQILCTNADIVNNNAYHVTVTRGLKRRVVFTGLHAG